MVPDWVAARETSTMPGYAGSSWYFLRYMDPANDAEFCNRKVSDYWGQVDVYVGGTSMQWATSYIAVCGRNFVRPRLDRF